MLILTARVLELVHAALSMHVVYHYLINNYANPLGLLTDVWYVVHRLKSNLFRHSFWNRSVNVSQI